MQKKKSLFYGLFIVEILLFVSIGFLYITRASRNIIFMDYWRYVYRLLPEVMNDNVTFGTIWNGDFGQRNPFMLAMVLFNIKFTELNCLWEEYAGIITIGVTGICLFWHFARVTNSKTQNEKLYAVSLIFIPVLIALYNMNQWEILSLEFSFPFTVRILLYIVVFLMMDEGVYHSEITRRTYLRSFFVGGFSAIEICFISQLYFVGMVAAVTCMALFAIIFDSKGRSKLLISYLYYIVPCIAGSIFYFHGLETQTSGGNFNLFIEKLFNGEVLVGIFYMFAGSLMPQSVLMQLNTLSQVFIGVVGLIILCLGIFMYFWLGLYRKTFIPVALIAYGLMNICAIVYGRITVFDTFYLTASRDVVETTLIWVGCAFIFAYGLLNEKNVKRKAVASIGTILVCGFLLYSGTVEWRISVFRGQNKDACISLLINSEGRMLTEDEAALFQSDVSLINESLKLLDESNLNIYSADYNPRHFTILYR